MDFSERQKMSLDIVVTAENVQTGVCFDISGVKKKTTLHVSWFFIHSQLNLIKHNVITVLFAEPTG